MRALVPALLVAFDLLALPSGPARSEPWVFKADEFPDNLGQAADIIDGGQFYTQPGFVAGEAFGQIYRPQPEMFPMQITGFDLILAAPPYAADTLFSNATIEVYNSDSKTPDPGTTPIFSISTADLFNPSTQSFGFPLQGNVGISVDFDLTTEENRPPMLIGGNIWLVIRFDDPAMSLSSEWGTLSCLQIEGLACGCQNVGTLHDSDITPHTNVIHHISPLGQCSGPIKAWSYMEDIPALTTGFAIDGDVVLRLRADVAQAPCVPDCDGLVCGDDGCGGSCGTCAAERFCVDGACVSWRPDCLSKQCGDDGCGNSCGTCGSEQTCGDDFFCHASCTPSCDGKACGDDGCGHSCGTCGQGLACEAGRCEATCAPACDGKQCGPDGCGGSCGTCGAGLECAGGACQAACAPSCQGKTCGDDGCGGVCGTCGAGETCTAGVCATAAPAFVITDVSPASGMAMQPTEISITGHGFAAGAKVKVGAADCTGEQVTGDSLISATVPGLPVGVYSVIVINPDEATATLPNAFQVNPVDLVDPDTTSGRSSGGCAGGASPGLAALLALGALVAVRRRA